MDISPDAGRTERRLPLAGVPTAVLKSGDGPPLVLLHGQGEFAAEQGGRLSRLVLVDTLGLTWWYRPSLRFALAMVHFIPANLSLGKEALRRVKTKYDPKNRFRVNQNIAPAEDGQTPA